MFETGTRQLRMAMSMVRGRPINPRNVERLIGDALLTLRTFGAPGDDVRQLLDGPFADPKARREFQNAAIRRTAERLGKLSPYYRQLFGAGGIVPDKLTVDDMTAIPMTTKRELIDRQRHFLVEGSHPYLSTRTTGTTGRPTEVWLSRYEVELWPALGALSGVLRGEIGPDDCMQINISSRATAAVQQNLSVCRLVGASSRVIGVVAADESIDSLLQGGNRAPTLLNTYPSYLASLVGAARCRGLGPDDFRLRRIDCGGEVLSAALAQAATETFGARVNDTFGMTEVLPVSGRVCDQSHLHHDLNMGFIEVIDLETGAPAPPGGLGTTVITPYYPYRECMPVFRYDTRDIVRRLPDEPLTCELGGIPGTSRILGKADHVLKVGSRVLAVRDIVEIIEAMPSQPWPARFSAAVEGGRLRLTMSDSDLDAGAKAQLRERFAESGLDVEVRAGIPHVAPDELRPLRVDLLETTFAGRSN